MTAIHIAFPGPEHIALAGVDELPEHEQIWLWDLLYAATLHECHGEAGIDEWREDRAAWAVNMVGRVFQSREEIEADGGVGFSPVVAEPRTADALAALPGEPVVLELVGTGAESLPGLRASWPDELDVTRRMAVVDALGNHFIAANALFLRELPLHIMAMQKYYHEQRGPDDVASVGEAPVFALTKAMEYFETRRQQMVEPVTFMGNA